MLPQIHGQNMPGGPEFIQVQAGDLAIERSKFPNHQRQSLLNVLRLVNEHGGMGCPVEAGAELFFQRNQIRILVRCDEQHLTAGKIPMWLKQTSKDAVSAAIF